MVNDGSLSLDASRKQEELSQSDYNYNCMEPSQDYTSGALLIGDKN